MVNPAVTGSSPCLSQKLFRAIFFGTVRLFSNFFRLERVPPSSFFDILQQTKVPKSPKGLFMYFGTMGLFKILIFRFFFRKLKKYFEFFLFLKGPLQFIWYFATNWIFKKSEGSRFYRFKNRFLSLRYSADFRCSRLVTYGKQNYFSATFFSCCKFCQTVNFTQRIRGFSAKFYVEKIGFVAFSEKAWNQNTWSIMFCFRSFVQILNFDCSLLKLSTVKSIPERSSRIVFNRLIL